ncbi:hypothetical protein ACFOU2_19430 [Bacillus songklensis]|uniref:OmpR/PhoB-type domain-containing protein n=1 Tax=Bacillus songklensis TaxID=1069116 RepID=A0ABV8B823_9BACI
MDVDRAGVPNLEMSPLYEVIRQNEGYLQRHAFTAITPNGIKMCTREECEEMAVSCLPDTIVLYFSDRQHSLFYDGREEVLSVNHAEMLRYFLLYSTEETPVTKDQFYDLFQSGSQDGEVPKNTFIQAVGRLRRKLVQSGAPSSLIENKTFNGQTAYYFNRSIPFLIMHRSDDTFILNR